MIDIAAPAFRERLRDVLERHEGFVAETRWFDGSILLECGDSRCWLKIYRGRVLEALDTVPPFGFTFAISGAESAWQALIRGERLFADLITPGRRDFRGDPELTKADGAARPALRIEGNAMEASRILEALFHLAECILKSAS